MPRTQYDDTARAIVVHEPVHVEAALAAARAADCAVTLLSPPGASAYMGAGYFRALVETGRAAFADVAAAAMLDCGDRAGDAMGALREGLDAICFTGPAEAAGKLAQMAAACGAGFAAGRPDALDLEGRHDPETACRAWLAL